MPHFYKIISTTAQKPTRLEMKPLLEKQHPMLSTILMTRDEIYLFVQGVVDKKIPDYQIASYLMAVKLLGMTDAQSAWLTDAMAKSGQIMDLSAIKADRPIVIDKHSSGGVGDDVSLVVGPIVACHPKIAVPKMSGRGLGHTGGTLDKEEALGIKVSVTPEEFTKIVTECGLIICGQTGELAPADGILYAMRDVTGTVGSIPLIAASIMSKKLAGGTDIIVLEVKVGNGAFMKDLDSARQLAKIMVAIGKNNGKKTMAIISDMNQPLNSYVGNALAIEGVIETLQGRGSKDFTEHCLVVAGIMFHEAGVVASDEGGKILAQAKIDSGEALAKFREMTVLMGGDSAMVDDPKKLPQARLHETITCPGDGYLASWETEEVGNALVLLGGGRMKKTDVVDPAVGFEIHAKVGTPVAAGAPIITIHANDPEKLALVKAKLEKTFSVSDTPVEPLPLFYELIR